MSHPARLPFLRFAPLLALLLLVLFQSGTITHSVNAAGLSNPALAKPTASITPTVTVTRTAASSATPTATPTPGSTTTISPLMGGVGPGTYEDNNAAVGYTTSGSSSWTSQTDSHASGGTYH
ncbi:MAG: hypothetical protein WCF84_25220, partial [Anaerolineae bacterium]